MVDLVLPANTVLGRLGSTPGPAEAIPLARIPAAASAVGGTITNAAISGGTIDSAAITGGTIKNQPAPTAAGDVANKQYVDSFVAGLIILPQCTYATNTVLPNTPTYANGTAGVGATLTAGANSTLTIDGAVVALNTFVLVKDQSSTFQNGIYKLTTAGSGAAAWVLTRATYFDQAAEMTAHSYTFITAGTANANTAWVLQTTVATVGTDALTWNLYSQVAATASLRTRLAAATNFYIRTDGSDGNNGLANTAGGAFLTLQGAYDKIYATYDFVGTGAAIVNIAAGNYISANYSLTIDGPQPVGTPTGSATAITFVGDISTPSNVLVRAGISCLVASWGATISICGVRLVADTGHCAYASAGGRINFTNFVDFNSAAQMHVQANMNGVVVFNTGYFITGSAAGHLYASMNGSIELNGGTVTSPGVPGFGVFATAINGGTILASANYSFSAIGVRYYVDFGAIDTTAGSGGINHFPGSSPGAISANGGKYA